MREILKEAFFGTPILAQWHKVGTINKENHHLVDWKPTKGYSESVTNHPMIWDTQITTH